MTYNYYGKKDPFNNMVVDVMWVSDVESVALFTLESGAVFLVNENQLGSTNIDERSQCQYWYMKVSINQLSK